MQSQQHPVRAQLSRITINLLFGWNFPANLDSGRSVTGMRIAKSHRQTTKNPALEKLHYRFNKNPTFLNPPTQKTPSAAREARTDLTESCRGRNADLPVIPSGSSNL